MVKIDHEKLSVVRQSVLLGISRSSLYYVTKGISTYNLALMRGIDRVFTRWPFLGVRQMRVYLVLQGYTAGRKRVRRLMRLMGSEPVYQKPRTSVSHPKHKRYPCFWATGSNKQLNFVQHIHTLLNGHGKAAVVMPGNVLFEGGAGKTVRQKLLKVTDFYTILRLPTGVLYKLGVKTNIIFFDRRSPNPEPQTKEVWVYDFRTNVHFTLKQNPMTFAYLRDFIDCYNSENRHERHETWNEDNPDVRFRRFTYSQIMERGKTSLDIF
ncbi:MAG: N-6 DNA methylase [Desulfarculales bacterium]|jgi:hypothetical protein|nr:N-6 DNA methylase [Desulfarculales bacterium]